MVVDVCNLRTWVLEARSEVQGYKRPCLKKQNKFQANWKPTKILIKNKSNFACNIEGFVCTW